MSSKSMFCELQQNFCVKQYKKILNFGLADSINKVTACTLLLVIYNCVHVSTEGVLCALCAVILLRTNMLWDTRLLTRCPRAGSVHVHPSLSDALPFHSVPLYIYSNRQISPTGPLPVALPPAYLSPITPSWRQSQE